MKNRIEQEINKTLQHLGDSFDIQPSGLFTENLSSRIAKVRISHGVGYRTRAVYPVAILLMILLNFAILAVNFTNQRPVDGEVDSHAGIMADEYGLGQNSYINF